MVTIIYKNENGKVEKIDLEGFNHFTIKNNVLHYINNQNVPSKISFEKENEIQIIVK